MQKIADVALNSEGPKFSKRRRWSVVHRLLQPMYSISSTKVISLASTLAERLNTNMSSQVGQHMRNSV